MFNTGDLASHYCGFYVLECHCFVHLLAGLKWPCPDDTDEAATVLLQDGTGLCRGLVNMRTFYINFTVEIANMLQ